MDTIAAIATPNMAGSIATIRISGGDAFAVAGKVFRRPVDDMAGYTARYGRIYDGDTELDNGVVLVFRAPKSYTGEYVAEITCHGGVYVARRVLQACLNAGARLAEPGEFTKRAVLNGKLTLTQAESVIDVINAQSERYLACCNAQKSGALEREIERIAGQVLSLSAHISAWIDYPDEIDEEPTKVLRQLSDVRLELSRLVQSYDVAKTVRDGVITAIVGKPNAGKSTLMNLLTRKQRSIVTDVPGTTRDVVEETVDIGGTLLRLCDCAGIRESDDVVERIGIEYMYSRIEEAALVIAVFDNSRALEKDDYDLIERIRGKSCVCVVNKSDLPDVVDLAALSAEFGGAERVVRICAKNPEALQTLSDVIVKACDVSSFDLSAGFIANERQRLCVIQARELVEQAIAGIESNAPLDTTGFLLEQVLEELYRLSGKSVSADIINEVFEKFCVGK